MPSQDKAGSTGLRHQNAHHIWYLYLHFIVSSRALAPSCNNAVTKVGTAILSHNNARTSCVSHVFLVGAVSVWVISWKEGAVVVAVVVVVFVI